ncbi:cell division protein FtsQ/DivIB [Paeniclostridium hominis]|uniref:cell division protein FtsQ/DivIB n=1 Tax=Paeniclostridium hominis TaxID=2764329 RepID=UPI0022DE9F25|nr:FtsQ-type POTRA domain-containing protein [Paeniclostridium hominis]
MRKSRYRINKRGKITIYSFILLIILLIYICISSSIFDLKEVTLKGNDKIVRDDIIKISSIKIGNNLFQYNINEIKKNILKNPYINYVKVSRKIPNKLIIEIKENTEDAIIKVDKRYFYIQEDGLILSEKNDITNKHIPIIKGIELKEKDINTFIKTNNNNQGLLIKTLKILKDNKMLREIKTIDIKKNYINMENTDDIKITMKLDENIQYNVKRLNEILIDLKSNNIKKGNVNLVSKEQAVYSP